MSVLLLTLALAVAAGPRDALGIYESWGAFRDADPLRCYAIARPLPAIPGAAFAGISSWPRAGVRNQFAARASRALAPRSRPTLSVGERRFDLVARGAELWAPDPRTDAAIVAALRSARSMSVEGVDARGRPFADTYALRGAASAIDAAALGCARR